MAVELMARPNASLTILAADSFCGEHARACVCAHARRYGHQEWLVQNQEQVAVSLFLIIEHYEDKRGA